MKNKLYAQREIDLAKDSGDRDRVAYWSAYLGDFEQAREYAVSDKVKGYIDERQTEFQLRQRIPQLRK